MRVREEPDTAAALLHDKDCFSRFVVKDEPVDSRGSSAFGFTQGWMRKCPATMDFLNLSFSSFTAQFACPCYIYVFPVKTFLLRRASRDLHVVTFSFVQQRPVVQCIGAADDVKFAVTCSDEVFSSAHVVFNSIPKRVSEVTVGRGWTSVFYELSLGECIHVLTFVPICNDACGLCIGLSCLMPMDRLMGFKDRTPGPGSQVR